jgi:hypothetical protein
MIPLFFPEAALAYRPSVYDGWVFVKGSGILDKRSFLPNNQARAQAGVAAPEGDGDSGTVAGTIRSAALGVLAIALALALVGMLTLLRARARG